VWWFRLKWVPNRGLEVLAAEAILEPGLVGFEGNIQLEIDVEGQGESGVPGEKDLSGREGGPLLFVDLPPASEKTPLVFVGCFRWGQGNL